MSRWSKWRRTGTSRRAFLGGAAAAVTLPFLPSLAPRADDVPDVRLIWWYVPNGMHMPAFTPPTVGAGYGLPPILAPLGDVADQVSVLTGLHNLGGTDDRPGDHARGTGAFLTCMRPAYEGVINGVSIDQAIANQLEGRSPFPSLQLGAEGGASVGQCDSGYSCAYVRNVSWAGPSTPLPKQTNPQAVFDRLFSGFDAGLSDAERAQRTAYRGSVLDHVREEARRLQGRVSAADKLRVEEYLTGVRALEVRIATAGTTCEPIPRPPLGLDEEAQIDTMSEIMTMALQCNLTRLVTFMLGNAGSNRTYGFIGASGAHHEISHHQDRPENFDKLTTIGTWEIERFAHFLRLLRSVPEGEGTMLDHSLVMLGSEISDGNRHNHDDLPVLLAGSGGGAATPGRHIVHDDQPVADLYLAMAESVGVQLGTFGLDGTRPLDTLKV